MLKLKSSAGGCYTKLTPGKTCDVPIPLATNKTTCKHKCSSHLNAFIMLNLWCYMRNLGLPEAFLKSSQSRCYSLSIHIKKLETGTCIVIWTAEVHICLECSALVPEMNVAMNRATMLTLQVQLFKLHASTVEHLVCPFYGIIWTTSSTCHWWNIAGDLRPRPTENLGEAQALVDTRTPGRPSHVGNASTGL